MTDRREALFRRIDDLTGAAVEIVQAVVRIDSRNPNLPGVSRAEAIGGESRVNDLLEECYRGAGLMTTRVAEDPERSNLVGIRRGVGGGRSLALNAHVDTVAPNDPGRWQGGEPWSGEILDGHVYGVGSTDMKGAGGAMWLAAQAIEDVGIELLGDLHLHSVVGEEMMEHELGTSAVIRAAGSTDAAIVTEPSSIPMPLSIAATAPSALVFSVSVEGRATHSGNRPLAIRPGGPGSAIGVNALEKIIPIVAALQSLETEWGAEMRHPMFPDGWFTIGPNMIHADAGVPVPAALPDKARVDYVAWHDPTVAADAVKTAIATQVHHVAQLDPWLREHAPVCDFSLSWPGFQTEWEHPLVQTMVSALEEATGRRQPAPSPASPCNFGAACDATFYDAVGIPSIVFGPGQIRIAHSIDERIDIDEIINAAKALAGVITTWCGVA